MSIFAIDNGVEWESHGDQMPFVSNQPSNQPNTPTETGVDESVNPRVPVPYSGNESSGSLPDKVKPAQFLIDIMA